METRKRTVTVGDSGDSGDSGDGADLHVEERGSGEALLLLHGHTGTSGDWQHLFDLDDLARRYRVVMPDARGHGRSTNPGGRFTFARCGQDALAILDALGIDRAKAIGVSLGAKTLLHAASRAPSRFAAMILVSATPRFPEATKALFRAATRQDHSPDEWKRMRALHVHGDEQIARLWSLPESFADDAQDMSFTGEQLGTITARTLIVAGDRDPFYPVELAVELYRGIPRSSLWVVPDALHNPIFLDQRAAFGAEVRRFFGQ